MNDEQRPVLAEAHGVTVRYGERTILDDVHLRVHAGEIVTLIGPNGAGKSTLVRIMLGLQRPDSGMVSLAKGVTIGYVPQRLAVEPTMPLTVRRFLTLLSRHPKQRLSEVLHQVGVEERLDAAMQTLSGGELQRVLLARALLRDPDLLFLDEPVQGVDVSGQGELYELIGRLRDEHGVGRVVEYRVEFRLTRPQRLFRLLAFGHDVAHRDEIVALWTVDRYREPHIQRGQIGFETLRRTAARDPPIDLE